jgi:hypothetical protein
LSSASRPAPMAPKKFFRCGPDAPWLQPRQAREAQDYPQSADPASGFCQRSSGNRPKSPRWSTAVGPCSIGQRREVCVGHPIRLHVRRGQGIPVPSRCRSVACGIQTNVRLRARTGPGRHARVTGLGTASNTRRGIRDNSQGRP